MEVCQLDPSVSSYQILEERFGGSLLPPLVRKMLVVGALEDEHWRHRDLKLQRGMAMSMNEQKIMNDLNWDRTVRSEETQ